MVWLWNLTTEQPTGVPLPPNLFSADYVAFSGDSTVLASGSEQADGVRLWDVTLLGDPFTGICTTFGWLSADQWRAFAPGEPYEPPSCAG